MNSSLNALQQLPAIRPARPARCETTFCHLGSTIVIF